QYATSGRISRRTTTVGTTTSFQGLEEQLDQSWNTFGLPATQSYPQCLSPAGCQAQSQARTLTYGYTNGLLTSIPSWASVIHYEPNGTVRVVEHSNNLSEVWVPDPKGMARPCRISAYWSLSALNQSSTDECGYSEPATPVWTTGRYQYDGSGNIKQIGSTIYTYDGVNRLREVTPGGGNTESYTYDAFGNRTTPLSTTQPCTFMPNGTFTCSTPSFLQIDADPATNRVKIWTYDAAGNATSDGLGGSSTWDGIGTMRSSLRGGHDLHFLYNADDERIALVDRIAGRNKTTFTLRGLGNELLRTFVDDETSGSQVWSWKEDEIWRGGSLLANVTPAGTKHLVLDHLGSPRAISTVSMVGVSVQSFSPFGMGGVAGSGSLMFTAHERDSATVGDSVVGHPDYLHARYYGPTAGRFLSIDPAMNLEKIIHEPDLWNRYSYVGNNPLKYMDSNGRERLERYHFNNVPTHSDPGNYWRMPLFFGTMLVGGPAVRSGWQTLVSFVLGNPQRSMQLVDAALSPPGSSTLPNPEGLGKEIGQRLAPQATGKMAAMAGEISGMRLSQAAAATAVKSAVEAMKLRTTGVMRIGENLVVGSVQPGMYQPVIVIDVNGVV
ncbi:MAG TPA: RHS repeat-associated core domain-containing protein, partial [Thermoanaerobaculia bacterium]|nr:RHS repeat-associated core domain-containing protein [Thermoanaerobaculia bacterium]